MSNITDFYYWCDMFEFHKALIHSIYLLNLHFNGLHRRLNKGKKMKIGVSTRVGVNFP